MAEVRVFCTERWSDARYTRRDVTSCAAATGEFRHCLPIIFLYPLSLSLTSSFVRRRSQRRPRRGRRTSISPQGHSFDRQVYEGGVRHHERSDPINLLGRPYRRRSVRRPSRTDCHGTSTHPHVVDSRRLRCPSAIRSKAAVPFRDRGSPVTLHGRQPVLCS